MAPVSTSPAPVATTSASVNKAVFPDGYKTSGQHPANYSLLQPYDAFPKQITGPTVWAKEHYQNHPERWTHVFSESEIAELSRAADDFLAAGHPLTGMTKEKFPLPTLAPFFQSVRNELLNGKGFILFKGVPVQEWSLEKCAAAYLGFGAYFGYFVSQNGKGHVLGHVKDLGEDPTQKDRVRIYRTNAKQYFHTDGADLVGLLCLAKALEGGESDIVSTHHVFNYLQQHHSDVVQTLVEPNWWFDRKGEVSAGQEPYYRSAIVYLERESSADGREPRVWARFDPNNVTSLARFNSGLNAAIPPLSEKQLHALKTLEDTCTALSLHMILDPGDIQLLSNTHVFHARTAYKDYPPRSLDEAGRERKRRHLMRLWLSVPEAEGGWRTPLQDHAEVKRGGIQVDDVSPRCPIDAE